ncbi:3-hydroxyacyl-CoA dehydrogenase NAD-binding domain-containing protein [Shimazuella sp. AN120528]|uniref:3-hydroxyacyl-CoA dehydrogenase/enoyl-CoA hydratase family protein n=1 Tax=Shimazuella soli TaxID=1892854 RepID=UPI001F0DE6F6|nr:3-hydroxyacyl-CoA dehydrogenase/enoyl-CoA hydratase family protein [Shimazuella soli]MCH5586479.1 3-hydroxyacyl-CoA dehydrogenase NAD-binding domain-containing protein [Shimazuella soli]
MLEIKQVAVLGAGVMGRAIAAHFANAGFVTYLFDRVPENEQNRNILAEKAKESLLREKPVPLFSSTIASSIQTGNFQDDFHKLAEVDWIIEAVVEDETIKQQLLAKVEQVWNGKSIISSNTSGISVNKIIYDRKVSFQQHFLGTHFFNPPRYMKLLELIPTKHTLPSITNAVQKFAEERLGKGVVIGRDTPNFIANRIGTYGIQVIFQAMEQWPFSPEIVDELTGPLLGRPKSATFRTLDLVGLDTYAHVVKNVRDQSQDEEERNAFQIPVVIQKLIREGSLGEKTKQGFYRKQNNSIQALDLDTWQYKDRKKANFPELAQIKKEKNLGIRLQALFQLKPDIGKFLWYITKKTLLYTATYAPVISHHLIDVDRAMKWGFNWDVGPFELWDQLGLAATVERMKQEGETIPAWVEQLIADGKTSFYQSDQFIDLDGSHQPIVEHPKIIPIHPASQVLIKGNQGASLIDIGDDVACYLFHSPKQAIGNDALEMLDYAVTEVAANYRGLVITGSGTNFSVGANLLMMLMFVEDEDYDAIDLMIRRFQKTLGSLRTCPRPVVAAPFGLTLGGGVEMCLPADRIQASAETYMGLVEVGVGLIPAGGGCKEFLLRIHEQTNGANARAIEPFVYQAFQTIGQAKVSTSALDAKSYTYLRPFDAITMNRDFLLHDAKEAVLALDRANYQVPQTKKIPVLGSNGANTMKLGAYQFWKSGYISEHDYKIASKLAYVLAGGEVPEDTLVDSAYLLDLEREAFLSLIGEPKTQARMAHMLRTGKPLRN